MTYLRWFTLSVLVLFTACGNPVPSIPRAPANVIATSGDSHTTVSWQDKSPNEDGFVIYRDTLTEDSTTTQSLELMQTLKANQNTFEDRTTIPGKRYVYYVSAKNKLGESEPSQQQGSPVRIRPSFEIVVGSANVDSWHYPVPVSAYLMLVHDEIAQPAAAERITVTIRGPKGWHQDKPYTFSMSGSEFGSDAVHVSYHVPLVTGLYESTTVVNGQTYQTSNWVDITSKLEASEVELDLTGSKQARLNWETVEGATSYKSVLWASDISIQGESTFGLSSTFDNLNLGPATYTAKVYAFNYDVTAAERPFPQFEMSIGESAGVTLPFSGEFIKVDPRGRFLLADENDTGHAATAISLAEMSLGAGSCFGIMREGDFASSTLDPDLSSDMIGVFKHTQFMMPGKAGNQQSVYTVPTAQGQEVDIAEDFMLPARVIILQVPEGATQLLLSADDVRNSDNSDPDDNFGVRIANVSCPDSAKIMTFRLGLSEEF